jgi:multicomponent Na+:H+ antiporter subunit G
MSIGFFIVGYGVILVGLFVMLIGSLGIIRLPDFFARTHAASMVDTVGIGIVFIGIAIIQGFHYNSIKVLIAGAFLMLTNPVAAHALARAAYLAGQRPWTRSKETKPNEKN